MGDQPLSEGSDGPGVSWTFSMHPARKVSKKLRWVAVSPRIPGRDRGTVRSPASGFGRGIHPAGVRDLMPAAEGRVREAVDAALTWLSRGPDAAQAGENPWSAA